MAEITAYTTIAAAIADKGAEAGIIIDRYLCDGERACCPGTSLELGFAARRMGKEDRLPPLLRDLNLL